MISDYRLPNVKTGLECIQAIRSTLDTEAPALIISGDTDPEILKILTEIELTFLHKPVKLAHLRIAVSRLVKNVELKFSAQFFHHSEVLIIPQVNFPH